MNSTKYLFFCIIILALASCQKSETKVIIPDYNNLSYKIKVCEVTSSKQCKELDNSDAKYKKFAEEITATIKSKSLPAILRVEKITINPDDSVILLLGDGQIINTTYDEFIKPGPQNPFCLISNNFELEIQSYQQLNGNVNNTIFVCDNLNTYDQVIINQEKFKAGDQFVWVSHNLKYVPE